MGVRSRLPYVVIAALALTAAGLPGPPDGPLDPLAACHAAAAAFMEPLEAGRIVKVSCAVLSDEPVAPEPRGPLPGQRFLLPSAVPVPVDLRTDGQDDCVSGPDRPAVATTTPVLSAAFAGAPAVPTFEYQRIGDNDSVFASSESTSLEFAPGELAPGMSYRWRVRGTSFEAVVPGWSDWCEFTVSPTAPDFREVEPGDVDLVRKLGVRPERRYTVLLSAAQQRALLEVFDFDSEEAISTAAEPAGTERRDAVVAVIRRNPGRITLTGAEWAAVLNEVGFWAGITADVAHETENEPAAGRPDASVFWRLADALSVRLGGPAGLSRDYFGFGS
jgi:hypothetical protein